MQVIVLGLLVASMTLSACAGAAAPATGSGGSQGQGGGGAGATSAASQGTSGGQGGGAATIPDACKLLTQDEIKAQFKVDVGPGAGSGTSTGAASPQCSWQPGAINPGFAGVTLAIQKFDQGYFDYIKSNAKNKKDVAGLGDAAYFESTVNPYTLDWKKGDLHFNLYVQAGGDQFTPDATQQLVVNLANNVLAHL